MTEYKWEKFQGVGEKYDARISITKSEFIGLPREFCKRNQIEKYPFTELFFDTEKKAVGIKFLTEKSDDCYRVNYSTASGSASISARSFFRFHRVDTKIFGGRYEAKVVSEPTFGMLYVIELKKHEEP